MLNLEREQGFSQPRRITLQAILSYCQFWGPHSRQGIESAVLLIGQMESEYFEHLREAREKD